MPLAWNWSEDRQWSGGGFRKTLNGEATRITWALEVRQGGHLMGEIILKGTATGDLTISLKTLNDLSRESRGDLNDD
jgi:hypothetical protein